MPKPEKAPTISGVVIRVAIAAFLWAALLGVLLVGVPIQKKVFDEYGLALPQVTMLVIDVSMVVADLWWAIIPCMLVGLLIAGTITWLIRSGDTPRLLKAAWTFVLLAPSLVLLAFVVISLYLPHLKLMEGLRK